MTEHKRGVSSKTWLMAALAFAAGPLMSLLHETDTLSPSLGATLWPIAFAAAAAAAGLLIGLIIAIRASGILGAVVIIPNVPVFLFYGFLLLFFGMGGSR